MIEWTLSSAALILIVIALRYILRGKISLRLQYALWGLVLLRLLLPFSVGSSGISVANVLPDHVPETILSAGIPDGAHTAPKDGTPKASIPAVPDAPSGIPAQSGTETVFQDDAPDVSVKVTDWGAITATVWLTGAAVVGLWLLISNLRLARKLKKSRQALACQSYRLPVYLSDAVDTPCLFGLFRPSIYVTPEAAESETRLRHILAHEATHFRHGDHLWSILRGVCLALHWYNPLVWWAAILSRNDSELSCDEGTIRRIGEQERAEYGRTLIAMTCRKRPALLITATTMTGGKNSIRERITLIARKPKTAVCTLIAVAVIAAVAVGCTFTGAKEAGGSADGDYTLYDCDGLTVAVPNEYIDQLIVRTGEELENGAALISVYEKASVEAAAADEIDDPIRGGLGWLFSLLRYDQEQYEQYLNGSHDGRSVFAQDGEWYYCYATATDARFYFGGGKLPIEEALAQWEMLNDQVCPSIRDDFIERNGLTPYSDAASDNTGTSAASPLDQDLSQLILDYYQSYQPRRVYFQGWEPGAPQEGDCRLESVTYLGGTRLYEVTGEAYEISGSSYDMRNGELGWQASQPAMLIVTRSQDGTYDSVLGAPGFPTDGMAVEDVIQQVTWKLADLEVALWRDGYPSPAGPGSEVPFYREAYDGPETVEVLEGWEPVYQEGDYWARHSWEGFEADCYHSAGGGYSVNSIVTTRTDLFTKRGVRVGDSRETVLAAYPELKSGDYWGQYPGEDYLWYCDSPEDFGTALLFFFEGDRVSRIVLNNMFD